MITEKDEFIKKSEEYLNIIKYEKSFSAQKICVTSFLKFYETKNKPIEEYKKHDFEEFLKRYGNSSTFASMKTRLCDLIEKTGYPDQLKILKNVYSTSKEYIKSFEELDRKIEEARIERFPFLKDMPPLKVCDILTVNQVAVYLAWLGVPSDYLTKMPLTAINTEKNYIDAGRIFSYADNPKMIDIFTMYRNADSFIDMKPSKNKKNDIDIKTEQYYSDFLIRPKKQKNCETANRESSISNIVNHISIRFKFVKNYLDIQRAGQFSRGYDKLTNGESPDFSSYENVWEYFNVIINTESQLLTFKRDWENYVSWRKMSEKM